MPLRRVLRARILAILILVLVLAAVTYGFAASNTVDVSGAGDGESTTSGYDITNVKYTLNPANPANISQVGFDVDQQDLSAGDAADVYVQLETGGAWYSCTVAANHVSCDTSSPAITALDADILRVVAAQ